MSSLHLDSKKFYVVGIGASVGGLESFQQLFQHLTDDPGMAFVLVQHLSPTHASQLVEILSKSTKMIVQEVIDQTPVKPNQVFIIPPNQKLTISKGILKLSDRVVEKYHPSVIDCFLSSLALDQGPHAIGVILSGSGNDGALGIVEIQAEGGITFAQDETAKNQSMPRAAISSGAVDFVLSPENISAQLLQIAQSKEIQLSGGDNEIRIDELDNSELSGTKRYDPNSEYHLLKILKLIQESHGIDFQNYKKNSLSRRISRRMNLQRIDSFEKYFQHLESNKSEIKSLIDEVLIKVTKFFRDPETFDELRNIVFPMIQKNRIRTKSSTSIKVWIPGCSTGEEVYSIAISLIEFFGSETTTSIQLFGTDISDLAISKARYGFYSKKDLTSLSEEQLKRFFVRKDEGYQIAKFVRNLCIFAQQNVTSDPPFSSLDIISCRNLLIYFEPILQNKVLPLFHYGLKTNGFLILGSSEAIGKFESIFSPISKKHKIFSKKISSLRNEFEFNIDSKKDKQQFLALSEKKSSDRGLPTDLARELDQAILRQMAPSGVVINSRKEIVKIYGHTGAFLEAPPGKITAHLIQMARSGLKASLHAAIEEASRTNRIVKKESFTLEGDENVNPILFTVYPLKLTQSDEAHFLIRFEKIIKSTEPEVALQLSDRRDLIEIHHLKQELETNQEYLQALVEAEQNLNEELKATNEEILSSNEEFQSTNEELETAKEELQSTNEELITLNDEMQSRNQLLSELNDDLDNLLRNVRLPTMLFDHQLILRRFSPLAGHLFKLGSSDIGNIFTDHNHPFRFDFLEMLKKVIETKSFFEQEIQDSSDHWYSLSIRPYETIEKKADGAVLVLFDVDVLKRARDFSEAIIQTIRQPLLVLDESLRVIHANHCFYETFEMTKEKITNQLIYDLGGGQWNIPKLKHLLEEILPHNIQFHNFEVSAEFLGIGKKSMVLNARRLQQDSKEPGRILLIIEDATKRIQAEMELKKSSSDLMAVNMDLEQFAYVASHDLQEPLRTLAIHMELLVERYERQIDRDGQTLIKTAVSAARRMQNLVKELLFFSQTSREPLKYSRTNCVELIEEVTNELETLIHESSAKIVYENLPTILIDRILLGQVFQNLITNAIKFRSTRIPFIVISSELRGNEWIFSVKDNGIGIEMQYQRKIFFIFQRLHGADAFGGSGIGLAICKRIVERFGGKIWLESRYGEGSTFFFSVPAEKQEGSIKYDEYI